jgi:restriction system protein
MESQDSIEIFLSGVAKLWMLWLVVAVVGFGRALLALRRVLRLRRSGIAEIDRMDGKTFERRLEIMFRRLGYEVEHVGRRGDYGADLVVRRNGEKTIVQAKRWTKNIHIRAVQEANAAPAMYGCSRAMVVTNRYFTQAAKKLARANRVELWDRDTLVAKLLETT